MRIYDAPHSHTVAAMQPPFCQLVRSILPISSHHRATQYPPQWMSESVLTYAGSVLLLAEKPKESLKRSTVNADQLIRKNVKFFDRMKGEKIKFSRKLMC
ncbi:MAG: hypothetical protein Q8N05_07925 [Bacteroidota bacterium]|nr:hypothetical protein [Bacteroidota bacterium]